MGSRGLPGEWIGYSEGRRRRGPSDEEGRLLRYSAMIPETGPYLKVAAICTDVIEGKDGVLSLVRIVDRATLTAAGPDAPAQMPALQQKLKIVLMLISGRARGSQSAAVALEDPSGMKTDIWEQTLFFEGEDRGVNCIVEMSVEFSNEGLYWFHVLLNGLFLTKLPYRLIYARAPQASGPR